MLTIWKFTIAVTDEQVIDMPASAKILTVHVQDGNPQIWALVNSNSRLEPRTFHTYGTGHPMENANYTYVGTYQQHDGQLVFHVFEVV